MFHKKIVIISVIILLIMAVGIYFTNSGYVFKAMKNEDVFKEYKDTKAETASGFISAKAENKEKFLVLYDPSEAVSINLKTNIENVLRYMKKDFKTIDISKSNNDFSGYYCIIIAFENLDTINNFPWILEYVKGGGNLIIAERPLDSDKFDLVYKDLGIVKKGISVSASGINLKSNILIKGNGLSYQGFAVGDVIPVQLSDDCKIYCVSNEGVPLIWERTYGNGKLFFANGQFLDDKDNRGLLVGIIASEGNVFIYPIINAKVNYIDDFPSPSPNNYNKVIYDEYGKSVANFYREIWWPDMLKASQLYDIKYSAFFIETYNALVSSQDIEKDKTPEDKNNLIVFGRELLKDGGEIGLHGYNHQPLGLTGYVKHEDKKEYKGWLDKDSMAKSIDKVKSYINTVYPNYEIQSYVPPSNILSPEGRQILKQELPSLKIISSLYVGDPEIDDSYVQEYGVGMDGIIDFPRVADGYKMRDDAKWDTYNVLTTHGVFAHFVHPDDILDSERNFGENWEALFKDYEDIQGSIKTNFPWLRPLTISEAGVELMRYSDCSPAFKYEQNGIRGFCQGFKQNAYYILRTERKIKGSSGCKVSEIDTNVYEIVADKPEFYIEFSDQK
ncbi:MAG: DUF2194 domain-containing protein [Bacillota bacterium]|nr:DUF2194 domain-containing protein [Bacillota bacterium]